MSFALYSGYKKILSLSLSLFIARFPVKVAKAPAQN